VCPDVRAFEVVHMDRACACLAAIELQRDEVILNYPDLLEAASGFEPLNGGFADLSVLPSDLKIPRNYWQSSLLPSSTNIDFSRSFSDSSRKAWPVPGNAYFDGHH